MGRGGWRARATWRARARRLRRGRGARDGYIAFLTQTHFLDEFLIQINERSIKYASPQKYDDHE